MRKKKDLLQEIENKRVKISSLQFDMERAEKRILDLMRQYELQKKEIEKYKTLYLQMLETNLILADKVGVNNE